MFASLTIGFSAKTHVENNGGVAGVSPARRGGEQRSASQGETSPS